MFEPGGDAGEALALPSAAAIANGPVWGHVRLTVPVRGAEVMRYLTPEEARTLALELELEAARGDVVQDRQQKGEA